MMNELLLGGVATAAIIAGLFFLNFWKATGDRFFLFFATSFWLEAFSRVLIGLMYGWREDTPTLYLIRLVAYGLILVAILDKNRPYRRG